jgi:hypothetical protein
MNCRWSVLIIVAALMVASCQSTPTRHEVSLGQAVDVGVQEAARLGYDVSAMEISADLQNAKWSSYAQSFSSEDRARLSPELQKCLDATLSWVIYVFPRDEDMTGGGLIVFVSKADGMIMASWPQR